MSHHVFQPGLESDHAIDYFHNRNSYPKKKERQEILAHLKEIGDTEAADTSLVNWFTSIRQAEKKRRSLLSIPVTEPDEGKWVDARHKSRKLPIPSIISSP